MAILIDEAIFESLGGADIVALFPEDFHKALKQLVASVIIKSLPKWKESVASSQISLPRLTSLDWRIDVKTSSDTFVRMAVPSVIVDMQVGGCQHFFVKCERSSRLSHLFFGRSKRIRPTRI